MRFAVTLFTGVVLAVTPAGAEQITTKLPPGGITLVTQNFSLKTPGEGWYIDNAQPVINGVPAVALMNSWNFYRRDGKYRDDFLITPVDWPVSWRSNAAKLPDALKAIDNLAGTNGVQEGAGSTGQCNTCFSLSAGVSKPKVFRGR